ncbi:hypothetical protein SBA1_950017 [Candidatus Sulfotelmatobacter kueseliae]|uniref:Uncharacterized protein n=1 Tax=Candidatus Sulfotelmatobacter kueseliae TaxID=2042962 RepID=A0A2U3LDA6_9BACT|nr:hypothetical protein SBA1_950017 [Candidatus Sulfotelmatobacter kueseliae]
MLHFRVYLGAFGFEYATGLQIVSAVGNLATYLA